MLKRLAELRHKHNLNQQDVADILNVKRNTYANYEQGTREMHFNMLVTLADHYKVSVDYLLERTDNPIFEDSYSDDEIEYITRSLELYREIKYKIK